MFAYLKQLFSGERLIKTYAFEITEDRGNEVVGRLVEIKDGKNVG